MIDGKGMTDRNSDGRPFSNTGAVKRQEGVGSGGLPSWPLKCQQTARPQSSEMRIGVGNGDGGQPRQKWRCCSSAGAREMGQPHVAAGQRMALLYVV